MAATAPITFFTVLFVMFLVCSIRVAPNQRRLVTHEQVVEKHENRLSIFVDPSFERYAMA